MFWSNTEKNMPSSGRVPWHKRRKQQQQQHTWMELLKMGVGGGGGGWHSISRRSAVVMMLMTLLVLVFTVSSVVLTYMRLMNLEKNPHGSGGSLLKKNVNWWERFDAVLELNSVLQKQPFLGVCYNDTVMVVGALDNCETVPRGLIQRHVTSWNYHTWYLQLDTDRNDTVDDVVMGYSTERLRRRMSENSMQYIPDVRHVEENNIDGAGIDGAGVDETFVDTIVKNRSEMVPVESPVLVSIVMPFHNNAIMTCQSLHEMAIDSRLFRIEVVLVDDASRMSQHRMVVRCLKSFATLYTFTMTILRNPSSMGYSYSCNLGAMHAVGEFLLFANNDMFVTKGAVGAMIYTLVSYPHVGSVGPLFIGDDNIVQEYGGVIYRDASAANALRGFRKIETELLMAHEVDYVSAACLMMKRSLFENLGGFDRVYGRGYYEDTDLAMKIREAGLKAVIQPFSIVYHQEGNTFGADSPEKRRLMSQNKLIFQSKWKGQLNEYLPPGSTVVESRQRYVKARILWIDQVIPTPSFDSGSQRTWEMFKILLKAGYHIDFCPVYTHVPQEYLSDVAMLRANGIRIRSEHPSLFLCSKKKCPYQAVFIARTVTFVNYGFAVEECCLKKVPVIFDTVDLHFLREAREAMQNYSDTMEAMDLVKWIQCANTTSTTKALSCMQHYMKGRQKELLGTATMLLEKMELEISHVRIANITLVLNEIEETILSYFGTPKHKLLRLSNIYPDRQISAAIRIVQNDTYSVGRSGCIFVGSFQHIPNRVALEALLEISTAIQQHYSDFKVHVVGSHSLPEKLHQALITHSGIDFHGWLPDHKLKELYTRMECSMTPLKTGAGVKGKVAAAYLYGIPVIGSKIAVEGMGLTHGLSYLHANTVEEYVTAYTTLHTSPETARSMVLQGIHKIIDSFSSSQAAKNMTRLMQRASVLYTKAHKDDSIAELL